MGVEYNEKMVVVSGKKVVVREILAREIEEYYVNEGEIQKLAEVLQGDHAHMTEFIAKLSDLDVEKIRDLPASQYIKLVEAIREVNADFFVTWEKEIEKMRVRGEGSPSPTQSAG